ncbi:cadherin-like protein 26 [Larimichthys crocea]|uniref:cadherin-like protein 26 n=1 Tax=Larimichthys crocea TaxID=215358 RepID=UPI000F5FEA72|nr:cadherin-like protein 26 [Larimichthys crocea]
MLCFFLLVYYWSIATCSGLLSRQKRAWIIDSFTIEEGHKGPFPYELGKIHMEQKYRVHFELHGQGVDKYPKGLLSIDKESGMVYVHRAVDYEDITILKLRFQAMKDVLVDTSLGVEISIKDINDNPPRFLRDLYEINLSEGDPQGTHVLTVVAFDIDKPGTLNSTFHYEIKSVSPAVTDTEFYVNEVGAVSFKGCLDHQVADKFTVLVEAIDHGEVVRLSSSTTVIVHVQDGNNNRPTITGQTGSGKVKEGKIGVSPLRLHVTDRDTPNSPAWRAKYTIHGDNEGYFKIETDPDTNDGILTVVKPLDYEEGAQRNLSISVENEMPYFSCKVEQRTSSGLWKVDTSTGDGTAGDLSHSVSVLIEVEDTNDPPMFTVTVKQAMLEENAPIGTWVEKMTAVDHDSSHARDFVYKIGSDPAGWLTVDPHTGDITTVNTPDRESPHVVNGTYTILLNAVDNGDPPMTGTATLSIHVTDMNDNVPQPTVETVDVCLSDNVTTTDITAFDPDGIPFGGPFTFELLEDVKGKWKLSPSYGYTTGLVKEPGVYAGPYTIVLKISDLQGKFGVYNINVTVCDCSVTPNCRIRRNTATKAATGAIGIVFASLFLLLFLLLLAFTMTSKKEFTTLQTDDSFGETLLASNVERPGTDCKIPETSLAASTDKKHQDLSDRQDGMQHRWLSKDMAQNFTYKHFGRNITEDRSYQFNEYQTNWYSQRDNDYHHTHGMSKMDFRHTRNLSYVPDSAIQALLHRRLSSLQKTGDDLLDYQPHIYADEGDCGTLSELEQITIRDNDDAFQKALEDLGSKFNELASICRPPHLQI